MTTSVLKANSDHGFIEISNEEVTYEIRNRGIGGLFKTYKIGAIDKSNLTYVRIRKLKDQQQSEFIIDYKEFLENGRFIPKQLKFKINSKEYASFKQIEEYLIKESKF